MNVIYLCFKKNLTLKFVNSLQKLDKQCSEYKIILVLGPGFKFIKIIKETPNDMDLGEKIRYLKFY